LSVSPGSVSPRNTSKISKFFGTVISADTASALQSKAQTLRNSNTYVGFGSGQEPPLAASQTLSMPSSPPTAQVSLSLFVGFLSSFLFNRIC
jgi:hypothetical protein